MVRKVIGAQMKEFVILTGAGNAQKSFTGPNV
jgi:hypothetical protein